MPARSCWRPTARMDSRRWTHHGWLRSGEAARAARCAFWRGFGHDITGEQAQAGGWFERARRLVDEAALDCVEQGYVLVPGAMRSLMVTGDAVAARAGFARVAAFGRGEFTRRQSEQDHGYCCCGGASGEAL